MPHANAGGNWVVLGSCLHSWALIIHHTCGCFGHSKGAQWMNGALMHNALSAGKYQIWSSSRSKTMFFIHKPTQFRMEFSKASITKWRKRICHLYSCWVCSVAIQPPYCWISRPSMILCYPTKKYLCILFKIALSQAVMASVDLPYWMSYQQDDKLEFCFHYCVIPNVANASMLLQPFQ